MDTFYPVVPWTHYLCAGLAGFFLSVALIALWFLVRDILTNRSNKITLPDWDFQPERDEIRIIGPDSKETQ
tara:strand:+ start:820 stop:1032 length:213 start_codon:yes stop_codon:yes gene_type:complete